MPRKHPPAFRCNELGIMLRLHKQYKYLPRVFKSIRTFGPHQRRNLYICIMLDRPDMEVMRILNHIEKFIPETVYISHVEAPRPLVSTQESFMEALQIHYEYMRELAPLMQVCAIWDDDFWFPKAAEKEARKALDNVNWDRTRIESKFLWDSYEQINTRFPRHWQDFFFRVYENDDFDPEFIVHSTKYVSRSPHIYKFKEPLINAGYMYEEDRVETFQRYKRAGKLDRHTFTLINPPRLQPIEWQEPGQTRSALRSLEISPHLSLRRTLKG